MQLVMLQCELVLVLVVVLGFLHAVWTHSLDWVDGLVRLCFLLFGRDGEAGSGSGCQ